MNDGATLLAAVVLVLVWPRPAFATRIFTLVWWAVRAIQMDPVELIQNSSVRSSLLLDTGTGHVQLLGVEHGRQLEHATAVVIATEDTLVNRRQLGLFQARIFFVQLTVDAFRFTTVTTGLRGFHGLLFLNPGS